MTAVDIYLELSRQVSKLQFEPPVEYVYNPLDYAWRPHRRYLERFATAPKRVIFLGMNPGPFGMAQTGVPFGDVRTVGEWLAIREPLGDPPPAVHPKRPILGLDCPRVEVSGDRLWGWIRQRWGGADAFAAESFIANYCPLVFLEHSGRNRTPDKLRAFEREQLYAVCDEALRRIVNLFEAQWVVAVGAFAEARARASLGDVDSLRIMRILHPSPASPLANRGWADAAEKQLLASGVFTWDEAGKKDNSK